MGVDFFFGYERPDGRFGVRNHLAVISSVGCINELTRRIAQEVGGVPVMHGQGCGALPFDLVQVRRVLGGIGSNPNVGAVLVVGLGCEAVPAKDVAADIASSGKPVELVVLQEVGGHSKALSLGIEKGRRLKEAIRGQTRCRVDVANLTIGVKCGGSDSSSGMVTNHAAGMAGDLVIAAGGTSIFTETTELIGAEHLVARRAVTEEVGQRLLGAVCRMEAEVARHGVDMRGSQPSVGNMAGGITTIEEKSLGAVCKAGSSDIQNVLEYGDRPAGRGLFFMDAPGFDLKSVTGLASGGAQVVLFTTGRGAPQGFPIVPVVKITANAATCSFLGEHIDVDVSGVMAKTQTMGEAAEAIYRHTLSVASGDLTKAEILGYTETMDIYTRGPII